MVLWGPNGILINRCEFALLLKKKEGKTKSGDSCPKRGVVGQLASKSLGPRLLLVHNMLQFRALARSLQTILLATWVSLKAAPPPRFKNKNGVVPPGTLLRPQKRSGPSDEQAAWRSCPLEKSYPDPSRKMTPYALNPADHPVLWECDLTLKRSGSGPKEATV